MTTQSIRAENLIGIKVKSLLGDNIGSIEALMIDKILGIIAYAVVSFNDAQNPDDKLYSIPWSMFSYDMPQDCFIIPIEKEVLIHSPGFNKYNWPDMSSASWRDTINEYYGITPDQH